jgi:hypothetical protein
VNLLDTRSILLRGKGQPMSEVAALLAMMGPHSRAHALQVYLRFPGLNLTSTYRTPERNRAVGGVPGSYHVKRRAADFTGSREDLEAALKYARRARIGRKCTGPEEALIHDAGSGVHLHLAW